jgi:ubiquinone/menaquinone biosynthesis C-methylase UbiE
MVGKIILIILGIFVGWQILIRVFRKLFHFPAPAFIGGFLDSNYRKKVQPPAKLIERSGIKPGMKVLDLGCGSGAFIIDTARAVGENGRVYALDIEPKMLKQVEKKLAKPENQDVKNVEIISKSAYELPFADNSLDLVYMVTVLQEIPDKNRALKEIMRALKLGGFLAVTELLPDPDYVFKSQTIKLVKKVGFVLDKASGNLWNYTVRFKKPS